MGRQKGDANRKNTRPSSSGLAASLLQTTNTGSIGFGGYIGSAQLMPTHASEGGLEGISGEVALHLQRLSKRDPTTKLKALEGLGAFIEECSPDELSQLLPRWIILYRCLVVDNSQQVREAAHNVMAKLALAAGRGLAPHLRALIGAWWISQYDTTRNVSDAAKRSFKVAFSDPTKRVEALRFTANDIFTYLDDSLKLIPQSISDKSTPMDESLEKLEIVLSSSLLAFATILDILLVASPSGISSTGESFSSSSMQFRTGVRERAEKLCISHKFFQEFTRSKLPQVRSAAYQALRSVFQNLSEDFVSENLRPVALCVLGSFGEKDPSCHTAMWDMILRFVQHFPQAWNLVQVKKVILPRFWTLLRNGFYGSVHVSYPSLLPLISFIPADTMKPAVDFLSEFFSNLFKGHTFCFFKAEDTSSFLKSFKECFLWIMNNTTRFSVEGTKDYQIHDLLLNEVLFNLLWRTYVLGWTSFESGNIQNGSSLLHGQIQEGTEGNKTLGKDKLPDQFIEALGDCLIELFEAIAAKDLNLFRKFWNALEDDYIKLMIDETKSGVKLSSLANDCVNRISRFFLKLAELLCKGTQMRWLLGQISASFAAKLFLTINSSESLPNIDLLTTIVSACGPMPFGSLEASEFYSFGMEGQDKENYDRARNAFKDKVIPWCLGARGDSTLSKINLLLSFFENENFTSEWSHVLTFATKAIVIDKGNTPLENEKISILATLIEAFRQKYFQLEDKKIPVKSIDSFRQWDMSSLEAAIFALAESEALPSSACLALLRNSLGGWDIYSPSIVSMQTIELVFQRLLKRMLFAITDSAMLWADYAASLILSPNETIQPCTMEKGMSWELARAALQAIGNSIYCLGFVDSSNGNDIASRILATIFFLDWLYNMPRTRVSLKEKDSVDVEDTSSENEDCNVSVVVSLKGRYEIDSYHDNYSTSITVDMKERDLFMEVLTEVCGEINNSFCRHLRKQTRIHLFQTLTQCMKFIIFEKSGNPFDNAVIYADWTMDVLRHMCYEKEEIDHLLDLLFEENMHWPLWTKVCCSEKGLPEIRRRDFSQIQEEKHSRFVAFIDRIIFVLGWDIIFADFMPFLCDDNEQKTQFEGQHAFAYHCSSLYRICILIELLCTWSWPGGSALHSVLPFLQHCALQAVGTPGRYLVDTVLHSLIMVALTRDSSSVDEDTNLWMCVSYNAELIKEPFLRALLVLISNLLQPVGLWGKVDAVKLYRELILERNLFGNDTLEIAPLIIAVLTPTLRRQEFCTGDEIFRESALNWLHVALSGLPLCLCQNASEVEKNVQMAISHFLFHPAGGVTTIAKAASSNVSIEEKQCLVALFRKQASCEDVAGFFAHAAESHCLQDHSHKIYFLDKTSELTLAKLVATVIAYCWEYLEVKDWKFVINLVYKWLNVAVINIEEMTEAIDYAVRKEKNLKENSLMIERDDSKLEQLVSLPGVGWMELAQTAVDIFSLMQTLERKYAAEVSSLRNHLCEINWKKEETKITENILRLFFASGLAESILVDSIAGDDVGKIYSCTRKNSEQLWERIAEIAVNASDDAKMEAANSVDIWGIGKGAVRALYALLVTPYSIPTLQWAAYQFLSTGPFQEATVVQEDEFLHKKELVDQVEEEIGGSSQMLQLRYELLSILDIVPSELFNSEITSSVRICYLLGWAIFLTRLNSCTRDLPAGESLIQYVEDSSSISTLLDFLFHYIPVKPQLSSGTRAMGLAVEGKTDAVAAAANRAVASGSISFAIEGLWPAEKNSISIVAGAMYGLILRVLPAHARVWFIGLRDRVVASAIESFTVVNCSPQLLMDEYSEVQILAFADESVTVKANRTTREIYASYKKEEAGIDMIIKLPSCYPLRPVEVDCTKQLGISGNRRRKWILSMAAFLRNQNGAVARAVQIWKQNVDREFEGVEECPICYSITHTTKHSLPRLACKTCKHKFHHACLYKWFSTSHKSTCPLCQTPF